MRNLPNRPNPVLDIELRPLFLALELRPLFLARLGRFSALPVKCFSDSVCRNGANLSQQFCPGSDPKV